jgi:isoamylase
MLQAGDEFGRTQRGNNNAYCQDNEISWVDWRLARSNAALLDFVRQLLRIRADNAVFRRQSFLAGVRREAGRFKDVAWLKPDGTEFSQPDWFDPGPAGLRDAARQHRPAAHPARSGVGDSFLVLFNAGAAPVEFTLPAPITSEVWEVVLDTSQEALTVPATGYRQGHGYRLDRNSLALLADHG